ncbi:MAG: prenyltransferase/squalene oxidase repeat-containing protein, partial [Planctomycetota bacterium]
DGPVARRCVDFLRQTVRDDASWPIDTNLAAWATTLSVKALNTGGHLAQALPAKAREQILDWLLAAQHTQVHPYTQADPGGWAWTDLSGGVPDADDTAGALLALHALAPDEGRCLVAAERGITWLLGLQNRDGGIPTFCRGWGRLDFDRSAADLTAHALLSVGRWRDAMPPRLAGRIDRAGRKMLAYLARVQQPSGAWSPLWFGNQHASQQDNPVYGTARVLIALSHQPAADELCRRGVDYLLSAQHPRGGWGGAADVEPSVEETAVAVDALSRVARRTGREAARAAAGRGAAWLIERTDGGRTFPARPIGLYFARLWYSERLYPLICTVSALHAAADALSAGEQPSASQRVE